MCKIFASDCVTPSQLAAVMNDYVDSQADGSGVYVASSDTVTKAWPKQSWGLSSLSEILADTVRTPQFEVGDFVIGHGRTSSNKAKGFDNTHPLQKDGITLVHNGVVHGGEFDSDKTDSWMLVDIFAKYDGDIQAIATALTETLTGWAAVVAHSKHGVYIWRSGASLHMNAEGDGLMLATNSKTITALGGIAVPVVEDMLTIMRPDGSMDQVRCYLKAWISPKAAELKLLTTGQQAPKVTVYGSSTGAGDVDVYFGADQEDEWWNKHLAESKNSKWETKADRKAKKRRERAERRSNMITGPQGILAVQDLD